MFEEGHIGGNNIWRMGVKLGAFVQFFFFVDVIVLDIT